MRLLGTLLYTRALNAIVRRQIVTATVDSLQSTAGLLAVAPDWPVTNTSRDRNMPVQRARLRAAQSKAASIR